MSNQFRVPEQAFREFLRPRSFASEFVLGRVSGAPTDNLFRWAEFSDVLQALIDHRGREFADEDELYGALFSGSGGGMGIHESLIDFVRGELIEVRHE